MTPARFDYARPTTLEEALAILARAGDACAPLAGGQSLMPMMAMRVARPQLLMDLNRIAGLDRIANMIQRAGIAGDPPRFPALCLGAFETSLKDITAAYTVFATGGVKLQPYIIDRVLDSSGNILYKSTRGRIPVVNPAAAH